jgi:hypothetical protein
MAKKKRSAATKAGNEQGPFAPPLPDRRAMERVTWQFAADPGGEETYYANFPSPRRNGGRS